ncbi:MAG: PAS domain-containing sensor histidine kinase [Crocinitomicaceae bacterium]|nr:PAS domain-containing sensor histidine kinase [Crocinitomicaceae bacterium]
MRGNFSSKEGHIIKSNIREFDPFAAKVLAEYCEQLIRKKQNRLNISESILLKSIELEFSDEEQVIERELAGVIRSAKRILEDTSESEWSEEHKQLFLLLKKIVFVGLEDDEDTSDSDVINHIVDGLMRLDYSRDIPVFQVVDEERNIFNYFGFILDSLAQKFKESTVSVKAVNTFLNLTGSQSFVVTNANGVIRFVSERLERFLQQSASELIDQSIFDIIPSWKGHTFTEILDQDTNAETPIPLGLGDHHGEACVQLHEVSQDDTDFGDEADEIKEFVVSIDFDTSHTDREEEIYNNLTSIDSVIDAVKSLRSGNVSPSEHNYSLQTSLESLYRIKYSQLDKLNQVDDVENENIDPKSIVNSVLSELRFNKGFGEITFEVEDNLKEPFSADFETIYSILKHLVCNAVKYVRPDVDSNIRIEFSTNKRATIIEVTDNGIGIHQDDIDHIFDRGYRVSKSTDGYGLGLYFIQRCLARCKASIAVQSELNVGSKFTITLEQ